MQKIIFPEKIAYLIARKTTNRHVPGKIAATRRGRTDTQVREKPDEP
jgi:hypothetical protein